MRYYDFSVNQLEDKATELLIEFDKVLLISQEESDIICMAEPILCGRQFGALGVMINSR